MSKKFDKYYKNLRYVEEERGLYPSGKKIVSISGAGTLSGGIYERVSISGSADVDGDLKADTITISGSCDVNGKIEARVVKVSGAADLKEIVAEEVRISGAVDVVGDVHVSRLLKVSGAVDISGNVVVDERCIISGSFKIDGDLNGNVIEIELSNKSKIYGNILCDRIKVVSPFLRDIPSLFRFLFGRRRGYLEAKKIVAREVYLENTYCDEVEGTDVIIGKGCRIDVVKYKENISIDPTSTIIKVLKLDG
jgi:cytoskeletal protein CcmA (bactofilin family)